MPGEPITRRGRASRERIVELFAERGIAATTVDEVLAAAGAGKGLVTGRTTAASGRPEMPGNS